MPDMVFGHGPDWHRLDDQTSVRYEGGVLILRRVVPTGDAFYKFAESLFHMEPKAVDALLYWLRSQGVFLTPPSGVVVQRSDTPKVYPSDTVPTPRDREDVHE